MSKLNEACNKTQSQTSSKENECITNALGRGFVQKIDDYLKNQGMCEVNMEVSPGSKKGDNFCGTLTKIRIEAIDEGNKKRIFNWISKTAPKEEASREIIQAHIIYAREIYIYEKLLRIFEEFQRDKGVAVPFNSYPKYVLSYSEPNQENLVMQDMNSLGYFIKNKTEPLDYNHVKLILVAYAKLHAVSYAMKDQNPEEFQRVAQDAADQYFCNVKAYESTIKKFEKNYREQLYSYLDPIDDVAVLELLDMFTKNPYAIVNETIGKINEYFVVIHGDNWINNMLFKYDLDNPDIPTKVCLLDFQLARFGSPVFDLSYFIFSCTDTNLRKNHHEDMIKLYYDSMCEHLRDLGSNPDEIMSFEALKNEFKRYAIVGFYMSTIVLRLILNEDDEVLEWNKAENLDAMVEAMNFKDSKTSMCQQRIRNVIVDFANMGYFDFLKE